MNPDLTYSSSRALELLRLATQDPHAQFRTGQEEAIREIIEGSKRLVVVQKTGWGKSFVYFIATKLLRESGMGPTLLISPLLSLMRNQISAAERMGLVAAKVDSTNSDNANAIEQRFINNEIDILMITEMRLAKSTFQAHVIGSAKKAPSLLVVDEVHCISDWGHDFRPLYRRIESFIRNSPASLRVLGTTATANDRVIEDVRFVFGNQVVIQRGELSRNNLILQTIQLDSHAERLAWIADILPTLAGTGIIYVLTISDSEQVTRWLQFKGVNVRAYHSRVNSEDRAKLEQELLSNGVKALVATSALGMGFDKPDLTFVIHYQMPGSVIAYYQQVGRAGRGVARARGVLLGGAGDNEILNYFRESAFPRRSTVDSLLSALSDSQNGLSISQLETRVNLRGKTIEHALEMLSLESPAPVIEQEGAWYRTTSPLREEFWDRVDQVTATRFAEHEQMQEYLRLKNGHLRFLVAALNGDLSSVMETDAVQLNTAVNAAITQEAVTFLKRTSIPIEPRKRLPGGGVPGLHPGSSLPREFQCEEGRALAYWGDAGWGSAVQRGKYKLNAFQDDLVTAAAALIREWQHEPRIEWVTSIPSLRHPTLVRDFAIKLAHNLGLEYRDAISVASSREPQKIQQNSYFQAVNAAAAFTVDPEKVLLGPCLLVDDIVDSRWTFAAAGKMLRVAGSGPVRPFALATVNGGGSDA
jgi:ATP-dependent DNA helicase RecQ